MWALIAVGFVGRVVLAFKTYGVAYDIDSLKSVRDALAAHPLHVYSAVNGPHLKHWPYPPGFFPFIWVASKVSTLTGLPFHGWIQLPQIVADCAIAWLVQDFIGRRGASERMRIAAAALVTFGPSFWIISGYHGQIDAAAILPAVLALWLWDRMPPGPRRALAAGLLIGVGAAIKSVPELMLIALLPAVRSRREAVALVLPAIAIPLIASAPFLIADHGALHAVRHSRFLPGFGGISLLAQPNLASNWLHNGAHPASALSRFLLDHEIVILVALMAPFLALVLVRRPEPVLAAALLWSALLVLNLGFEFEFVVWALPFALMAGWLWQVAVVEAVLLPPAALLYWHPFGRPPTALYVAFMIPAWCIAAAALVTLAVRVGRQGPAERSYM